MAKSVWRTARDGQPVKLSVSPPSDVNDPSMFRVERERERRVFEEWIFNRDGKRRFILHGKGRRNKDSRFSRTKERRVVYLFPRDSISRKDLGTK